jgi:hypothetical protein
MHNSLTDTEINLLKQLNKYFNKSDNPSTFYAEEFIYEFPQFRKYDGLELLSNGTKKLVYKRNDGNLLKVGRRISIEYRNYKALPSDVKEHCPQFFNCGKFGKIEWSICSLVEGRELDGYNEYEYHEDNIRKILGESYGLFEVGFYRNIIIQNNKLFFVDLD